MTYTSDGESRMLNAANSLKSVAVQKPACEECESENDGTVGTCGRKCAAGGSD